MEDATLDQRVAQVREASRKTVRELGVLAKTRQDSGLNLSQCHVLLELDRSGRLTLAELAELLTLDKSTLSRAVAPLVEEGLVRSSEDPADRRRKPLELLPAGRARLDRIDTDSSRRVRSALTLLAPSDQESVVRGMRLYAQALERARRIDELAFRLIEPRDDPEVEKLIRVVMTEFGAVGCGYSIEDDEVRAMHAEYTQPGHVYFVIERDGRIVGGAGIAPLQDGEAGVCELRKMYFYPELRGLGAGARLLERCLAAARELGYTRCYLETLTHMHQAQRLYEKFGFERIAGPQGDTGHSACDSFYVLDLKAEPMAVAPD